MVVSLLKWQEGAVVKFGGWARGRQREGRWRVGGRGRGEKGLPLEENDCKTGYQAPSIR